MYIFYVNKYTHHGNPCEMLNKISHDDFINTPDTILARQGNTKEDTQHPMVTCIGYIIMSFRCYRFT